MTANSTFKQFDMYIHVLFPNLKFSISPKKGCIPHHLPLQMLHDQASCTIQSHLKKCHNYMMYVST